MIEKNFVAPTGWLRASEVLAVLGIGAATLERWTRIGKIESKLVPHPGRKSERVWSDSDVQRLKAQREKAAQLFKAKTPSPVGEENGAGKSSTSLTVKGGGWTYDNFKTLVAEWFEEQARVKLNEKLWLTWEEAGELSGIPPPHIRKLAEAGKIRAEQFGRSWRVLRSSLEQYRGSFAAPTRTEGSPAVAASAPKKKWAEA